MTNPPSTSQRLGTIERDVMSHAKTLTVLTEAIGVLERDRMERAIERAREEERDKATAEWRATVKNDVDEVRNNVKAMKDAFNRFAWRVLAAIFSSVGLAFLAWVYRGGMGP